MNLGGNKKARSLVEAAKKEMKFTLSLPITESSSSTIIRNIYESFRMLGEALLLPKKPKKDYHVECLNELFKLSVKTERPLRAIDTLRTLRHSINYDGYQPDKEEAKNAISIANTCFEPVLLKAKEILDKK